MGEAAWQQRLDKAASSELSKKIELLCENTLHSCLAFKILLTYTHRSKCSSSAGWPRAKWVNAGGCINRCFEVYLNRGSQLKGWGRESSWQTHGIL
ncbi:hypothetical protein DUNSADRAFT_15585 [Dunaliella salina]|uniref:Encoded protein n=1 Tax=Dunaliella salina TaxID=3046 RepID=A0ABQ7G545_DUNSA|nr:hypothetical protein DUNSADRAFT_15585 [Dunaliella salina]|eukprot:KAF5829720.1 hypothetical protein DUNSADRAFT_15585 [Dunaliella salina]